MQQYIKCLNVFGRLFQDAARLALADDGSHNGFICRVYWLMTDSALRWHRVYAIWWLPGRWLKIVKSLSKQMAH